MSYAAAPNGGTWVPLGVARMELAMAAEALAHGSLAGLGDLQQPIDFPVDMAPLEDVFEVGPTHHLIGHPFGNEPIGAFDLRPLAHPRDDVGQNRSLWAANSRSQKCLVVRPTHKAFVARRNKDQQRMWLTRSCLHYQRNMRWTSQALLAATTRTRVMGGRAWTSLGCADERLRAAQVLWGNSIFGMVVHWTQGQRTQTGRSTAQIGALRRIPCPRFGDLDDQALDRAEAQFRNLRHRVLRPACQAHADQVRQEIDAAVADFMGLPADRAMRFAADLRTLWCGEPSVHGFNRQALALLRQPRQG